MRKSVFAIFITMALLCAVVGIVSAASETDLRAASETDLRAASETDLRAASETDVSAAASVTTSLTYQGTLTDSSGNPLTGTGTMTFRLYDVASGGSALATDSHSVTITRGLFTTPVSFPSSYSDGRALWLGVQLASDPEMTPRQEIRPVPYAISLRPGGIIRSTGSTYALNLRAVGNYGKGLLVDTDGSYSDGVYAETSGGYSYGVYAGTSGGSSDGVYAETSGSYSDGVQAVTYGYYSDGVHAVTYGASSYGVYASSNLSYGVYAKTNNPSSYGIFTYDRLYAGGGVFPTADVAEYMPVVESVAPGTVLVIGDDGKLQVTSTAYDTKVAGIVSTLPGISLGAKEDGNEGEALIAVAGKVPCKVDASNWPIHPGDLLTTSDNPGYAMKATDPKIGTILGKAMGTMESGIGTIDVIVTLQ